MIKRLFDLFFSGVGLILLAPFFFVIAAIIKLSDRGPVFYRQLRVGLNGLPFSMLKFRSMVVNADRGSALTVGEDRRITGIGKWLRRLKLDELPQLWNVFRGEMSLVGPRPEVSRYVAAYTPAQKEVLKLKPGITDPASFAFFDESTLLGQAREPEKFYIERLMPEKIRINLEYGARANVFSDFLLVIATVGKMFGVKLNIFAILKMENPRIDADPIST